jgi:hypothetical protein
VQSLQPILERRTLAVGVDSDESQFTTPGHEHVVVAYVFVILVVVSVVILVSFNTKKGVPDDTAVINPA